MTTGYFLIGCISSLLDHHSNVCGYTMMITIHCFCPLIDHMEQVFIIGAKAYKSYGNWWKNILNQLLQKGNTNYCLNMSQEFHSWTLHIWHNRFVKYSWVLTRSRSVSLRQKFHCFCMFWHFWPRNFTKFIHKLIKFHIWNNQLFQMLFKRVESVSPQPNAWVIA